MPAICPTISLMNANNVDPAELAKFSELAHRWWDVNSEFRPLHQINPLRLDWIQTLALLKDKQVLDVGCGGGILTDAMARSGAHALGIDPTNGDVWIGDREDYRILVYSADGKFLRQIPTRNLVCAIQFDPAGNPWMATGQDGQFLKLDRSGRVLGAIGNGMGIGRGQFIEASYFVFDRNMAIYAGDTSVSRITVMRPRG